MKLSDNTNIFENKLIKKKKIVKSLYSPQNKQVNRNKETKIKPNKLNKKSKDKNYYKLRLEEIDYSNQESTLQAFLTANLNKVIFNRKQQGEDKSNDKSLKTGNQINKIKSDDNNNNIYKKSEQNNSKQEKDLKLSFENLNIKYQDNCLTKNNNTNKISNHHQNWEFTNISSRTPYNKKLSEGIYQDPVISLNEKLSPNLKKINSFNGIDNIKNISNKSKIFFNRSQIKLDKLSSKKVPSNDNIKTQPKKLNKCHSYSHGAPTYFNSAKEIHHIELEDLTKTKEKHRKLNLKKGNSQNVVNDLKEKINKKFSPLEEKNKDNLTKKPSFNYSKSFAIHKVKMQKELTSNVRNNFPNTHISSKNSYSKSSKSIRVINKDKKINIQPILNFAELVELNKKKLSNNLSQSEDENIFRDSSIIQSHKSDKEEFRKLLKKNKVEDSFSEDEDKVIQNESYKEGWVFAIDSHFISYWDLIISLITLYTLIYSPYKMAFPDETNQYIDIIECFMDLIFIFDIILQFFIPFYNYEEELIISKHLIALNYIKGWFFIDIIASIPGSIITYLLTYGINSDDVKNTSFTKINKITRLAKFYRVLKFTKLSKILKLSSDQTQKQRRKKMFIKEEFTLSNSVKRFLSFAFIFLFVTHMITCIWIFIGLNDYPNWIVKAGLQNSNNLTIYISSFYFHWTTIFTIGYGDILSSNTTERLYNNFLMFIGVLIYSFAVSSLGTIVSKYDNVTEKYLKNIDFLNELQERYHIPDYFYEKVVKFLRYDFKNNKVEKFTFINDLPLRVKNELLQNMFHDVIKKFKFFRGTSTEFNTRAVFMMKPLRLFKKEFIFLEGEFVEEIVFVRYGYLTINLSQRYNEIKIMEVRSNEHFGDISVLLNIPSPVSLKVGSKYCDLIIMRREDLIELSNEFSESIQKIFWISSYNYFSLMRKMEEKKAKFDYEQQKMKSKKFFLQNLYRISNAVGADNQKNLGQVIGAKNSIDELQSPVKDLEILKINSQKRTLVWLNSYDKNLKTNTMITLGHLKSKNEEELQNNSSYQNESINSNVNLIKISSLRNKNKNKENTSKHDSNSSLNYKKIINVKSFENLKSETFSNKNKDKESFARTKVENVKSNNELSHDNSIRNFGVYDKNPQDHSFTALKGQKSPSISFLHNDIKENQKFEESNLFEKKYRSNNQSFKNNHQDMNTFTNIPKAINLSLCKNNEKMNIANYDNVMITHPSEKKYNIVKRSENNSDKKEILDFPSGGMNSINLNNILSTIPQNILTSNFSVESSVISDHNFNKDMNKINNYNKNLIEINAKNSKILINTKEDKTSEKIKFEDKKTILPSALNPIQSKPNNIIYIDNLNINNNCNHIYEPALNKYPYKHSIDNYETEKEKENVLKIFKKDKKDKIATNIFNYKYKLNYKEDEMKIDSNNITINSDKPLNISNSYKHEKNRINTNNLFNINKNNYNNYNSIINPESNERSNNDTIFRYKSLSPEEAKEIGISHKNIILKKYNSLTTAQNQKRFDEEKKKKNLSIEHEAHIMKKIIEEHDLDSENYLGDSKSESLIRSPSSLINSNKIKNKNEIINENFKIFNTILNFRKKEFQLKEKVTFKYGTYRNSVQNISTDFLDVPIKFEMKKKMSDSSSLFNINKLFKRRDAKRCNAFDNFSLENQIKRNTKIDDNRPTKNKKNHNNSKNTQTKRRNDNKYNEQNMSKYIFHKKANKTSSDNDYSLHASLENNKNYSERLISFRKQRVSLLEDKPNNPNQFLSSKLEKDYCKNNSHHITKPKNDSFALFKKHIENKKYQKINALKLKERKSNFNQYHKNKISDKVNQEVIKYLKLGIKQEISNQAAKLNGLILKVLEKNRNSTFYKLNVIRREIHFKEFHVFNSQFYKGKDIKTESQLKTLKIPTLEL